MDNGDESSYNSMTFQENRGSTKLNSSSIRVSIRQRDVLAASHRNEYNQPGLMRWRAKQGQPVANSFREFVIRKDVGRLEREEEKEERWWSRGEGRERERERTEGRY